VLEAAHDVLSAALLSLERQPKVRRPQSVKRIQRSNPKIAAVHRRVGSGAIVPLRPILLTRVAEGAVEETISLYLELAPGKKPDLEVIGLAAAAFAEAVKEIAFILDPGMDVRLEFDSTTKASLSLNAVFKTLKTRDGQIGTLIGVIMGTSVAFVGDARQWTVGKLASGQASSN
jgi:hypothetical protein